MMASLVSRGCRRNSSVPARQDEWIDILSDYATISIRSSRKFELQKDQTYIFVFLYVLIKGSFDTDACNEGQPNTYTKP